MFLAHMPNFLPIENYSLFDPLPPPKKKKKKIIFAYFLALLFYWWNLISRGNITVKCNALSLPIFNLTIIYWLEKK